MKDPMKRFVQLFVVTVFLSASLPSFAASFTGKVLSVLDGDTITILRFGKPTQVKIAEIDCPEINQSFGRKAMKFTSRMTIGKTVRVHIKHIDSYDQIIGKVILEDGRNMSHTLVRAGLAWWDFMSSRDRSLWALEKNARRKRVGLWKNKYQVPPWEFQKGLGFLIDGKTSREEVLLRLGVPSGRDKRGRVLAYRMGLGQDGALYVTTRRQGDQVQASAISDPGRYNLVLIFNSKKVLIEQKITHARMKLSSVAR